MTGGLLGFFATGADRPVTASSSTVGAAVDLQSGNVCVSNGLLHEPLLQRLNAALDEGSPP